MFAKIEEQLQLPEAREQMDELVSWLRFARYDDDPRRSVVERGLRLLRSGTPLFRVTRALNSTDARERFYRTPVFFAYTNEEADSYRLHSGNDSHGKLIRIRAETKAEIKVATARQKIITRVIYEGIKYDGTKIGPFVKLIPDTEISGETKTVRIQRWVVPKAVKLLLECSFDALEDSVTPELILLKANKNLKLRVEWLTET